MEVFAKQTIFQIFFVLVLSLMDRTSKSRNIMGKNDVNYFPFFSNMLVLEKKYYFTGFMQIYRFEKRFLVPK